MSPPPLHPPPMPLMTASDGRSPAERNAADIQHLRWEVHALHMSMLEHMGFLVGEMRQLKELLAAKVKA